MENDLKRKHENEENTIKIEETKKAKLEHYDSHKENDISLDKNNRVEYNSNENYNAGNKCDVLNTDTNNEVLNHEISEIKLLMPADSTDQVQATECEDSNLQNNSRLDFEDVPTTNSDGTPIIFNGVEVTKLTKSQLKKYKRTLKWAAGKKEKRAKERLKMKNKIKEAKLNNKELGPSRKTLKKVTMATSSCKINVVIDMSFDDLMINKDIGKVIKQTLRVYTKNRRSFQPMQLHLTNFDGKVKEEMSKHVGYENWDINFHQVSYLDVFPKEKLVYLSSESENVITKLEEDKVYIIGGLVDHNSHKGICHKKAVEQGISHGQLPISEYFRFEHRKVFTINQVFEILLEVSRGKTFKEAFELTLPKRINMQPTGKDGDEDSEDAEETETVDENL